MKKKIGIVTQARTTSTRLPEKVLLLANGKSVLEHHINRLAWSNIPVYIATTINRTDDAIIKLAESFNIPYYRGDEVNVLERFYLCAKKFQLDIIIRVTSDCPLIDGNIIREAVEQYVQLNSDEIYMSNSIERTYPRGLDFEIFSFTALSDAFHNATDLFEKEHVTPFINKNRSGKITVRQFKNSDDWSNLRWTLDTPDDWKLLKTLIEDYGAETKPFDEILAIVTNNDALVNINNHIKQKEV
jgi:spore coat polysaccharide biosynthesis protein SpsF